MVFYGFSRIQGRHGWFTDYDDSTMQKKWKAFCRKIDTQTDDFNTVLKIIEAFLTEPFTAAARSNNFTEKWSAANDEWM